MDQKKYSKISIYEVPKDLEDPSYVQSFELSDKKGIQEFFDVYGFVVIRDVLTEKECDETIKDIFNMCRFNPADLQTWKKWPSEGMKNHAMPTQSPVFARSFLMNRQNPRVHECFSTLLGRKDLISNHDRCCLYRPTRNVFLDGAISDQPQWKTKTNLHIDMNPWKFRDPSFTSHILSTLDSLEYDFRKDYSEFIYENNQISGLVNDLYLQAVINLMDNKVEDGGFQIIPGFINHFNEWMEIEKEPSDWDSEANNSFKFNDDHPLSKRAVRISCRKGSVIVWDQRSPHGSRCNDSERMRAAQFIRMFPDDLTPIRRRKRGESLMKIMRDTNFQGVTDHGRQIFGLIGLD